MTELSERQKLLIDNINSENVQKDLLVIVSDTIYYSFPSFLFRSYLYYPSPFERITDLEKETKNLTTETCKYKLKTPISKQALIFLYRNIQRANITASLSEDIRSFRELRCSCNFKAEALNAIWADYFMPVLSFIDVWSDDHKPHYSDYIELILTATTFNLPITFKKVPNKDFLALLNKDFNSIAYLIDRTDCNTVEIRLFLYSQFIINASESNRKEMEEMFDGKFSI